MNEAFRFRFGEFTTRVLFTEKAPVWDGPLSLPVFDRHVYRLHGAGVRPAVVLPAGERSKTWASARRIIEAALAQGLGRDGRIAGVGGGVVCDLAAFAASLYMRGCRLLLAPTSLLGMVDAALGGKTAVNLRGAKNLAGTFYPAEELRIAVPFLATLPVRELRCGLAEALKTALLGDAELLGLLRTRRAEALRAEPGVMEEIVFRSLAVKGRIVENDFRESGARAVLNLGHTFAHALESAGGFRDFRHGEAVAWGLARALELGTRLGVTASGLAREVTALLREYGFRLEAGPPAGRLLEAMRADKKRREGRLRLVLLREVGAAEVLPVEEERVAEVLRSRG